MSTFYQAVVDWWKKEAASSQSSSFPLVPSPNVSCRLSTVGIISQVGKFASASSLSKAAMPPSLKAQSSESIKGDYSACCRVADITSVQNLLLFLLDLAVAFSKDSPMHDP